MTFRLLHLIWTWEKNWCLFDVDTRCSEGSNIKNTAGITSGNMKPFYIFMQLAYKLEITRKGCSPKSMQYKLEYTLEVDRGNDFLKCLSQTRKLLRSQQGGCRTEESKDLWWYVCLLEGISCHTRFFYHTLGPYKKVLLEGNNIVIKGQAIKILSCHPWNIDFTGLTWAELSRKQVWTSASLYRTKPFCLKSSTLWMLLVNLSAS